MKSYQIVLKDVNRHYYGILFWFIAVINFIAFTVISIYFHESFGRFAAIMVLVMFFLSRYFRHRDPFFNKWWFLFELSATWAVGGFWASSLFFYPAGVHLVIAISFYYASRKKRVDVTAAGIRLPSLFGKTLGWNELLNVVLKDQLLTIDQRNNRLFQQPLDEVSFPVDEKEFNEFCRQQLTK